MFDGAMSLGHVFERKFLDPERDCPRTYGSIQTVDCLVRHLTVKSQGAMASEMWFGLDAVGIGKRHACFQVG